MVQGEPATALPICISIVAVSSLSCISDLRERRIPNRVVIAGCAATLASLALLALQTLPAHLLWAAIATAPFMLISLLRPEAMGMGDAKLVFFLGLSLGPLVTIAVFCALVAGSLAGLVLILRNGAAARKLAIPLAPFLAMGALVAMGVAGADGLTP